MYAIQSVMFNKEYFTQENAEKWLYDNNYLCPKPRITKQFFRYRQNDPDELLKQGYDRIVTKKLGNGIELIIYYSDDKVMDKIKQLPFLHQVGSRKRQNNLLQSDYDFVTIMSLQYVYNAIASIASAYASDVVIIKKGVSFMQLMIADKYKVDIWNVQQKYLKDNIILRSMDKGHLIALKKYVREFGYKLNFDGLFDKNNKHISLMKFLSQNDMLFDKFATYLKS